MSKKWSFISISNNLFWLLIVCGIMLFAITFNIKVGWFLCYFFLFVLFCSLLSLRGRFNRYQIQIEPLIHLNQGAEETITLRLLAKDGRLKLPPYLRGTLELTNDQFDLTQKQSDDRQVLFLTAKIEGDLERGVYQSAQASFVSNDLFNLLRKTHRFPLETTILIMPQMRVADSHEVMSILSRQKLLPLGANFIKNQDVKALRDYREGDQLNQIDWKLSAKRDQLIVKEFESDPQEDLIFLFYGNDGQYYEEMLALFYTIESSNGSSLADYRMYNLTKKRFTDASVDLYTSSQSIHMEKQLVQGVQQDHFNKKRLIIFTARYSKALIKLSEELVEKNDVVVFYYSRQGQLSYECF